MSIWEGVVRRSIRDTTALADEILRRYRLQRRRQRPARRARGRQQPSQHCLAMTLFDLGKAFDLLVRADAWKAVGRLAEDASIEFFLEELHRGVCYILKDKHTGQLRKRTGDRTAITAQQQGMNTEVNVSDLKFMDDLVSFFDFQELGTLQRFIECVSAVFTQHSFQVNVGKLEVCVCAVVAGPGSQGPSREWHS